MLEHLSAEGIERYRQRRLSPAELLVAGDHLTRCEACQQRLAQAHPVAEAVRSVRADLSAEAEAEPAHLSYEQVAAHVDGELDEVDREIVEGHLELCPSCAARLEELRAFQALMTTYPAKEYAPASAPTAWQRLRAFCGLPVVRLSLQATGVAAATALVLFGTIVQPLRRELQSQRTLVRELRPVKEKPSAARHTPVAAVPDRQNQVKSSSPVTHPTYPKVARVPKLQSQLARHRQEAQQALQESEKLRQENVRLRQVLHRQNHKQTAPDGGAVAPRTRLVLNDGRQKWVKDERGKLVGVTLPPRAVELAINRGIELPSDLALLQEKEGPTRGGSEASPSFAVRSPAGIVSEEDQPTFSWKLFPEATSYRIVIAEYRAPDTVVIEGETGSGTDTDWKPSQPLQRGKIYLWQVRALAEGRPTARTRPARFKVLDGKTLEELKIGQQSGSHLALGLLYAKAGILDKAERELRILLKANPKSGIARKLLESVQAQRTRTR
jgi:anti-sigma factor RsiW